MAATKGLNTFRKNGLASFDQYFTVERNRLSATQGTASVYFFGVEIAVFGDTIKYINIGETYYGEINSRWASVVPNDVFIESVKIRSKNELLELVEHFHNSITEISKKVNI